MRTVRIAVFLVLALLLLAAFRPALGQDLELPGLAADPDACAAALDDAVQAGMNAAVRTMIGERAAQAVASGDWVHAVPLLKQRLGAGDTTPALWLALAHGPERLPTPDHAHALAAAWRAYSDSKPGPDQLPTLRVMQAALAALGRKLSEIEVLREESRLAPDDATLRRELVTRMQTYGLLVRSVHTQPESSPRECASVSPAASAAARTSIRAIGYGCSPP